MRDMEFRHVGIYEVLLGVCCLVRASWFVWWEDPQYILNVGNCMKLSGQFDMFEFIWYSNLVIPPCYLDAI